MPATDIIGLDVGQTHTGIARASMAARLAEPLVTVPTAEVITSLRQLMKDQSVTALVIGLPRNLDGNETQQTAWVRQWAIQLSSLETPIYWQDEALTSQKAINHKQQTTSSVDEHSLAAAVILQDWLDGNLDTFKEKR